MTSVNDLIGRAEQAKADMRAVKENLRAKQARLEEKIEETERLNEENQRLARVLYALLESVEGIKVDTSGTHKAEPEKAFDDEGPVIGMTNRPSFVDQNSEEAVPAESETEDQEDELPQFKRKARPG